MSIVDSVRTRWESRGLFNDGRFVPTFIEDVGSAAAENVRSAALRRWIHANHASARQWLSDITGRVLDVSELRVDREFTLRADSRVDLRVSVHQQPIAFIEVKWASPPADAQLTRYRSQIDALAPGAPLVLVSPLRHVLGQGVTKPPVVYLSDWDQLFTHFSPSTSAGSIENDLYLTVARWVDLQAAVREGIQTHRTTVGELRELTTWMDDEDGSLGADLKDYRSLLRQLILAEIADAFVSSPSGAGWRRCLTNRGANGDFQADVAPASRGDGWFPCPGYDGLGVALMLRVQAYPDFRSISLGIGSVILPYLQGEQKRQWCSDSTDRVGAVFTHATQVRQRAYETIRRAGLRPTGRADTAEWYKCIYSTSFSEDARVSELLEHATTLSRVLLDAAGDSNS